MEEKEVTPSIKNEVYQNGSSSISTGKILSHNIN